MDKQEFNQFLVDEYMNGEETEENQKERELISNILDKAEGMEEIEQYKFLCKMFSYVPEAIIRKVYY